MLREYTQVDANALAFIRIPSRMALNRSLIPDLVTLQAFEAAARFGSFTQAAAALNLTQSAVSRQVKDLETRLGLALFHRIRQRVILSDHGHRLLPEARHLLAAAEDMTLRAISTRDLTGVLRVACLPTFASRWLIPRLPGFLAQHLQTQITLYARSVPFDFGAEPFDLAIHFGQPVWPRARCTFLCREEVVPVVSSAFLARYADGRTAGPIGADHLATLPLLHLESRPKLWADWFVDAKVASQASAFAGHRFDQFAMVIEAAVAGIGAGLVPRYLVEQELKDGQLINACDHAMPTDQAYYSVVPDSTGPDGLAVQFQNWLAAQVGR